MQKDRGWTTDPKTVKLRGSCERFWAHVELFLNWIGLRVDFKEVQGLFSKTATANRYAQI